MCVHGNTKPFHTPTVTCAREISKIWNQQFLCEITSFAVECECIIIAEPPSRWCDNTWFNVYSLQPLFPSWLRNKKRRESFSRTIWKHTHTHIRRSVYFWIFSSLLFYKRKIYYFARSFSSQNVLFCVFFVVISQKHVKCFLNTKIRWMMGWKGE